MKVLQVLISIYKVVSFKLLVYKYDFFFKYKTLTKKGEILKSYLTMNYKMEE